MRIKVIFFAELKEMFGSSCLVDIREGATIQDAVHLLAQSGRFPLNAASLRYALNENFETPDKKLSNNDELALMTPMSGG
ncbi:MAG: MoaD/ThiS family protein [Candidatus Omnitrophica bacterium]|nr:MoaD/ThiS family protein [Candidatus Omnitrophota bacterium]